MSRKTKFSLKKDEGIAQETESKKYHKDVFDKISPEKREKILNAAAREFAVKGFEKARVSDIAKQAMVSHGSIYTYFETKDDILSYLIQEISELQSRGFAMEDDFEGDFTDILKTILQRSFYSAERNPYFMSAWLSLSFEYNTRFSLQVKEIEKSGIRFWQELLETAVARREISSQIDISASAYILDSVVANILRGYISEHEKMKLQYHFGSDFEKDEVINRIIKLVMTFLG